MSELYRHLLIPPQSSFVPELDEVAQFFKELEALGALPNEVQFVAITHTGKTRRIARNANTGEVYYGPELKLSRFPDLRSTVKDLDGETLFDIYAEGMGPTAIAPFDLYSADNYATRAPGALCTEPYPFSVRCRKRREVTHFLHSAFGCKCELKPDEPGDFRNPWSNQVIEISALGCARFWIEISIGNWLMPKITDSLDILDSRWVAAADAAFGVGFQQGCIRNDD